jgi:ribonuclease BN (tRNA processing enzyme)
MKVVFLGTNGWYNTNSGNTVSVLVETGMCHVIFDAGDGLHKIGKFIKDKKPVYIFLSHLHLDHITGFHTLNRFNFTQGIKIYGPKETKRLLRNIIGPPYSLDLEKLSYKVDIIELEEGRHDLGFVAEARKLFHSVDCLGYRIEIENKTIAHCLDTGLCDNAMILSRGADLLIAECSLKSGQDSEAWPHLNPLTAAKIAKEAKAKKLALTHFNPVFFPLLKDRIKASREARRVFPNSFCARDDLKIKP